MQNNNSLTYLVGLLQLLLCQLHRGTFIHVPVDTDITQNVALASSDRARSNKLDGEPKSRSPKARGPI